MNCKTRRLRSRKTGSAMSLVLIVVVVLLTMGTGLLSLGQHGRMQAIKGASEIVARSAADAGVVKALFTMNEKLQSDTWDDSNLPHVTAEPLLNCDGTFGYSVTKEANNIYTVHCTGQSGRTTRQVDATLRLQGLFDYGILTEDDIILKPNTFVDGYNPYDTNDADDRLKIGTRKAGDGQVMLGSGSRVDGEIETEVDTHWPQITPPQLPVMGWPIVVQGGPTVITSENNGQYTGIELKGGSVPGTLEIGSGNVVLHVTGNITMGHDCGFVIKQPNSSVTIYLDGDFIAGNSSGINNETCIPRNFMIIGTGENQTFDLKAKGGFYGVVYAPNATVVIRADSDIYGSFICSNFELKSGGNFYYDQTLADAQIGDVGAKFVIKRWRD